MNTKNKSVGKRRGCLGCLGRGVIGSLALLVVLMIVGAIYQSVASASDAKKYPPPGELYDVGGRRLHLYCTGEGSPTVILEAGASSPGMIWYLVQEEVAKFTRVCSYDRAGFGWSDPAPSTSLRASPGPLGSEQVASDLHELLETANIPAPYVLVGHSAGGVYVRAFAGQYPSEVVGMVLVDSSHESQNLRFPPEYMKLAEQQSSSMGLFEVAAPFGVLRATRVWSLMLPDPPLPADVEAAVWATMYRTSYCKAVGEEMTAIAKMLRQEEGPASMGDLPLIVLTANDSVRKLPENVINAIGRDAFDKLVQVSQELQQELASLSTNGKQVIVEDSGHYIQWDQPQFVIDAIREIVEQARGE
jgi:pimeloyl-ACP methyl ester carboxylesterase